MWSLCLDAYPARAAACRLRDEDLLPVKTQQGTVPVGDLDAGARQVVADEELRPEPAARFVVTSVDAVWWSLAGMERDESGRIGWVTMDRAMMYEAGACEEDADGIVNHALSVGEVEAVAFFKELAPGVYRISLRSKGRTNVAKVAETFGGGGHKNAAGCRIEGDFEEVKRRVIEGLQVAAGVAPVSA